MEEAEEVVPSVEEDVTATAEEEAAPTKEELEASSPVICSYLLRLFDCKIERK